MEQNNEKELSMAELLDQIGNSYPNVHDVVKGEVVLVTDKYAKVDINYATEGTIYLDHYTTDSEVLSLKSLVKVGDIIEAEVTKVSEERSEILLSRLNTLKKEDYLEYKTNVPVETNVEAKVLKVIEGKGYVLSDGKLSMFMSYKDVKTPLEKGAVVAVKILSYDDEKQNAYVSRYAVIREERQHAYEERQKAHEAYVAQKEAEHEAYVKEREEEYKTFKVGDVVKGTVANIVPYGAFVKFDKCQGLIRLKDVDHSFIKSAADILNIGDEVEVKVVSTENGKLELSRKALLKTPVQLYMDAHQVSDTVKGKVINKMPFGVLLELAPNVTGLLHKTELSWNPNDNTQASMLIGDEIEVSIIKFDAQNEKIGLSRKPLLDNPWARVEAKVGDRCEVTVSEVLEKAFVVSAFGVDGIVPFNQVDGGEKKQKATDLYQVGDKMNVVVTDIDTKRWHLVLSEKAYKEEIEHEQFENYMNDQAEDQKTTLGDIFKDQLK